MSDRKSRLAKFVALPVLAVCGFLAAATFAGVGLGLDTTTNETTTTTVPGGEGCTPGFWKNHPEDWEGYAPNQLFSSVFEDAFPNMTLIQVLNLNGGGLNALGRHTVAALLNAASSEVDYAFTTTEVINMFNAVFSGGDYEGLKNTFEAQNELEAPGFCD